MTDKTETSEHEKLVLSWARDPEKFIYEALRIREKGYELSTQQKEALTETAKLAQAKIKASKGEKLTDEEGAYAAKIGISIMSGKGTGKDFLAAALIIWMLCCFPWPKIPCTANSGKQLKDVLWSEIKKLLNGSFVEDWVEVQSERVFSKAPKKDDWGKRWFATARTVNVKGTVDEQAEALQGFHEKYMMVVIDEASGLPDAVFKPFETTLTGFCNFVIMIFNPTRSTGYAIESHKKNRDDWIPLQWSSEDSELVGGTPQGRALIARLERKYGRDSNTFRVCVLGLPPVADADTLIPYDWVIEAVDRNIEPLDDDPLVYGIDVGAGGDDSIMAPRHGGKILTLLKHSSPDTMAMVGWAFQELEEQEAAAAFVDVIGIGNGVYNRLRELLPKMKIYPVDARGKASNSEKKKERFMKLRDELWWNLRELFENRTISIPDDPELIAELTTVKYEIQSSGKVKVEGKKEMRKRGVDSPNRADAVALSFHKSDTLFRKICEQPRDYNIFGDNVFEGGNNVSSEKGWMAE
ncbi:MAG: hypothetical protein KAR06_04345 [Deltaproteobacteria bacterium]|nr:hypothetical protein [Deltaproteobacteria bacterium]